MDRTPASSLAGLLATAPMTVVMEALHRSLPAAERHPLPPRTIAMRLAGLVGLRGDLDEPERLGVTLGAHFAYGAMAGACYAPLVGARAHPAISGAGFGLAVWAASYLGLLPALGVLRSAARESAPRNGLMIAAHCVWGAVLGITARSLANSASSPQPARVQDPRRAG